MIRHAFFTLLLFAKIVGAEADVPLSELVQKLIADLESSQFQVRERAQKELAGLGSEIVPGLKAALADAKTPETRRRIEKLLALQQPHVYTADFNGWNWVYSNIAHGQSFETPGTRIKSLKLRVAQLSERRPTAPLEVEIRDRSLGTIYLQGLIGSEVLQRDFTWQAVQIQKVAPLQAKGNYVLLFHSRDNNNRSPWAINAIYDNLYPHGHDLCTDHQDFFFQIDFDDAKTLRVGPEGENCTARTPISSGAEGGFVEDGGPLRLQGHGPLPRGKFQD